MQDFNPKQKLDEDWIRLILTAKKLGLTKENVREFLKEEKCKEA